jgi:hypothetical protein
MGSTAHSTSVAGSRNPVYLVVVVVLVFVIDVVIVVPLVVVGIANPLFCKEV